VALPILLRWFILSFGDEKVTKSDQYFYAAAVCATTMISTIIIHIVYFANYVLSMRCRVALTSLIYRKSLRLATFGSNQSSLGHILNLTANDVHRLEAAILNFPHIFIGPIQWILFSVLPPPPYVSQPRACEDAWLNILRPYWCGPPCPCASRRGDNFSVKIRFYGLSWPQFWLQKFKKFYHVNHCEYGHTSTFSPRWMELSIHLGSV